MLKKKTKKQKISIFGELIGQKVSVLIDHAKAPDGIFKESYIGILIGEADGFVALSFEMFENGKLKQIFIRKDQILSIWVYRT